MADVEPVRAEHIFGVTDAISSEMRHGRETRRDRQMS